MSDLLQGWVLDHIGFSKVNSERRQLSTSNRNVVYSYLYLMMHLWKDQLEQCPPSAWVLIKSQLSLVMLPSLLSKHEAADDTANSGTHLFRGS